MNNFSESQKILGSGEIRGHQGEEHLSLGQIEVSDEEGDLAEKSRDSQDLLDCRGEMGSTKEICLTPQRKLKIPKSWILVKITIWPEMGVETIFLQVPKVHRGGLILVVLVLHVLHLPWILRKAWSGKRVHLKRVAWKFIRVISLV